MVIGLSEIQGIQGIQGEKGEKGDKGDQGIQGEKGDKGDKGEDADTSELERLSNAVDTIKQSLNDVSNSLNSKNGLISPVKEQSVGVNVTASKWSNNIITYTVATSGYYFVEAAINPVYSNALTITVSNTDIAQTDRGTSNLVRSVMGSCMHYISAGTVLGVNVYSDSSVSLTALLRVFRIS